VILPGITSSWKLIQTGKIKILKAVTISGSASSNLYTAKIIFFKNFNTKMYLK
jgi:hypothetical protein